MSVGIVKMTLPIVALWIFTSTILVADDPPSIQDPRELIVEFTNADGEPVVGAHVTPWAVGSSRGHGPWPEERNGPPPVLETDE